MSESYAGFDRYAQRRRDEQATQDAPTADLIVPANYAGSVGKICIVAGTLLLFPTGGLSGFLIFAGAMGLLGQRTSTRAHAEMEAGAEARDTAVIDRAFAHGVIGLIGWFLLGGFILLLLVSAMGVTL